MSKELRGISADQLRRIGEVGYLNIGRLEDAQGGDRYEYSVELLPRLRGGGPFLAGLTQAVMMTAGTIMVLFPPTTAAGVAVIASAPVVSAAMVFTPTP